ncbi:MAG: winged-helix domain-containing protein [Faecousia sp.]
MRCCPGKPMDFPPAPISIFVCSVFALAPLVPTLCLYDFRYFNAAGCKMKRNISNLAVRRMAAYLAYLKSLPENSSKYISATSIADALHLGQVQVRKDLAKIAGPGHTKVGREKEKLISDIERQIGLYQPVKAVLIGSDDFLPWFTNHCGDWVLIAARFTTSKKSQRNKAMPLSQLTQFCSAHQIQIGILNTSSDMLYSVVDMLKGGGVHAIWNFSPVPLENRDGIMIQNENLIPSLGILSFHAANTPLTEG